MNELTISRNMTHNVMFQFMNTMAELISVKVADLLREEKEAEIIEVSVCNPLVNPNELLSINEVKELLKVKRGTIYNWKKKRILLPDTFIGRSPRYKRSTIESFIKERAC